MAISGNMFSIGPPGVNPVTAGAAAAPGEASLPGGGFSAALAQAQSTGEAVGQGLAVDAAGAPLAAVSLSPSLRVITGGQAAMDAEALLAFAQQQGLSPQAIDALRLHMQPTAPDGEMAAMTLVGAAQVVDIQAAQAAPVAQAGQGAPVLQGVQAGATSAWLQAPVVPASNSGSVPGSVPGSAPWPATGAGQVASVGVGSPQPAAHWLSGARTPAAAAHAGAVPQAIAVSASASGGSGLATAATTATASPTTAGQAPAPDASAGTAAPLTSALSAASGVGAATAQPAGSAAALLGNTVLESSLAGLWAAGQRGAGLRDGLGGVATAAAAPAPAATDLSQAPALGAGQLPLKTVFQLPPTARVPAQAPAPGAPVTAETLVLDGISGAEVTDLEAQAPALSRHSSAASASPVAHLPTPAAPAGAPSPTAAMAEAQAKYEAVAQQLGEALAQRLSAQIQRGHWQVKLHLHPQELGSIDVQLGMRGGDLMASFQASQQMTRDMLQDQMPRLREMLAGAGIDVASTDVNAQSGGRSGGNSTQAEARGAAPSSGTDAAAAKAEPTTVRAAQANDDRGLDLWA